jgi:cadmium resistance protein CadD (predicted permease)
METLITAAVAFAATNLDDLLILALFFADTRPSFRWWHIVAGQYLGFIALVAVSLPGFLGSLVIPGEWLGFVGLAPIAIGIGKLFTRGPEEPRRFPKEGNPDSLSSPPFMLAPFIAPGTYLVASVTFANGGDNVGIYAPLFASGDLSFLVKVVGVFLLLVAAWCWLGYRLARRAGAGGRVSKYGEGLVPWVLIGLGVYILWTNGSLEFIGL